MASKFWKKVTALTVIMVVLLVSQAALAAEVQLSDVPESHWAYQGVKKLVQEGYLGVFEDGTFQGQKPVDRYTLASVVGNILIEMEKGQLGVTQADLDLLRKLSTEFRDELVRWYNERETLGVAMADTQERVQVMDDTITRVIDTMEQEDAALRQASQEQAASIMAEIAKAKDELAAADAALLQRVDQQEARLTAAEDELIAQGISLEAAEAELAKTSATVDEHGNVLKEHTRWLAVHGESLVALEEAVGVKVQTRLAEREAALSLLQSELEAKDAELESELKRIETQLADASVQVDNVESKLIVWQDASLQRDTELSIRIEGLEAGVDELSQALRAEVD
ncbi:MAG: hypothetical protein GX322_09125, partial [Firmicutes bacterium]|nr:hypothetical protein [Bacillota bacterium]